MNPHLLIITVGIAYIVIFGAFSLLRREGLSAQFAIEVLGLTLIVVVGSLITQTTVNPILFLAFIYLISMRGRLLVDLANYLSNRGRQRDAISILQLSLRLYPDHNTRMIVLVNMGIVQVVARILKAHKPSLRKYCRMWKKVLLWALSIKQHVITTWV